MKPATTLTLEAPGKAEAGSTQIGLSGSMGTFRLFALVMAFVSPLVSVAGWVSILIVYGGEGAPLLMLAATVVVLIFSMGFVAMGHHMPNPGAFYSYVGASLGRVVGLGTGFVATLTYAFLGLACFIFFGIVAAGFVVDRGGPDVSPYWYALAMLILVSIFGYFHIEVSAKVLLVAMAIEILIVVIFDFAVFAGGTSPAGGVSAAPFSLSSLSGGGASWGIGILFAILLFNGFEGTAVFREEVRNPARTIGRASVAVVLFVGVFYAISSWALISYFGGDKAIELATSDPAHMFTNALAGSAGQLMVDITNVMILTSSFAGGVSIHSILSRYIFSLGVDRVLPRQLATVHPRHNSPFIAAIAATVLFLALAIPFVLAGSDPSLLYGQLGGTGGYAYLLLFTLVSLAVFVYFWRKRRSHSVNKWVAVVAPGISILAMGTLFVIAIANFSTLTGGSGSLAVILQGSVWGAGVIGIVLALIFRAKRPEIYARIGRRTDTSIASAEKASTEA
ncbi:APC family permease [Paenarthrobacter nicotinovorans]|uniref:APC family permease n=1 Tax=Paenarthrobacter nicotinovorans TaxID=29320 RepID=UPI0039A6C96D